MIRRIVSLVIITSMILHCASRLGTLSYLYEKRYEVAYAIGIIEETPIAQCSSDYTFNNELTIQHEDSGKSLPLSISQASEIILFNPAGFFNFQCNRVLIQDKLEHNFVQQTYISPPFDIFHPPSALS